MTNKLHQIQTKIREVCPEDPDTTVGMELPDMPNFGLSHVLRAMGDDLDVQLELWGGQTLAIHFNGKTAFWNLAKPLHEQDDSVIDFLHSILCVQKS